MATLALPLAIQRSGASEFVKGTSAVLAHDTGCTKRGHRRTASTRAESTPRRPVLADIVCGHLGGGTRRKSARVWQPTLP